MAESQEETKVAVPEKDLLGYGFAALVVVGGLIGFKKGSKQSLGAGLLAGAGIGFAANRVSVDPSWAFLGIGICGTLAGVMGFRYYKMRAFMPAGLVAGLSGGMAVRYMYIQTKSPIEVEVEVSFPDTTKAEPNTNADPNTNAQ